MGFLDALIKKEDRFSSKGILNLKVFQKTISNFERLDKVFERLFLYKLCKLLITFGVHRKKLNNTRTTDIESINLYKSVYGSR